MCVCNAIICNKHYVYYKMQNLAVMYYKTPIDWPYSRKVYVGFPLVAVSHSKPSGKTDILLPSREVNNCILFSLCIANDRYILYYTLY